MADKACEFCGRVHRQIRKPEYRIVQESGDYHVIRKTLYYADGHGARTCYHVQSKTHPAQDPAELPSLSVALEVLYALSGKPRPKPKIAGDVGTYKFNGKTKVSDGLKIYKVAEVEDGKVVLLDDTNKVISTRIKIGQVYAGFSQDFFDCLTSYRRATVKDKATGVKLHLILDRLTKQVVRVELAR